MSTQELVALVRELQAGYRPDLVLFYDGVNDTTSALLEGRPTLTTNEINRVREFNLLQSPGRLAAALAWNLVKNSGSFRVAQSLGGDSARGPAAAYRLARRRNCEKLADGVVARLSGQRQARRKLWASSTGSAPVLLAAGHLHQAEAGYPSNKRRPRRYGWTRTMFRAGADRIDRQTPELTIRPGVPRPERRLRRFRRPGIHRLLPYDREGRNARIAGGDGVDDRGGSSSEPAQAELIRQEHGAGGAIRGSVPVKGWPWRWRFRLSGCRIDGRGSTISGVSAHRAYLTEPVLLGTLQCQRPSS